MKDHLTTSGVHHPLTTSLGLTDEQRLNAEREHAAEIQRRAARNLRRFALDEADFELLADALGLTAMEG